MPDTPAIDETMDAPIGVAIEPSADGAQLYDFRRPRRVSKERHRALEAMYERLVKSFEGWLLARMRGQAECKLARVEQLSFGEVRRMLNNPCCVYSFSVRDSGLSGMIDIGDALAFYAVERIFGGSGTPVVPSRALTSIEKNAVQGVAERICTLLSEIWEDAVELELEISGFESFPEILQIANTDDPMLVAVIDCQTAGKTSQVMAALPFGVLDKFFVAGEQRRVAGNRNASAQLVAEQSLRATGTIVSAQLPPFDLTLEQLAAIEPGITLQTGIPADTLALIHIGGQLRFMGAVGRSGPGGQNIAVCIEKTIGEAPRRT